MGTGRSFSSCGRFGGKGERTGARRENMLALDYGKHGLWISEPMDEECTKPVDVFFVYPTVYVHPSRKRHHLMPIESGIYRMAARVSTWWHDRIFAESFNIFAPFYRQMGMETLWMKDTAFSLASHIPYLDIRNAFFHYLKYHNKGRPFLLAGHSQGSETLLHLMKKDFAGLAEARQLVAAYLIGYSVTEDDLAANPHLRMASGEDDLGGIISYNTSAEGLRLLPVVRPGAVGVNPLNWRTDEEYAPKALNQGSVLLQIKKFALEKKHFTGAHLDKKTGVLMIDQTALDEMLRVRIGFLDKIVMHRQSLHTFDIALFHRNLERNAKVRAARYLEAAGRREEQAAVSLDA